MMGDKMEIPDLLANAGDPTVREQIDVRDTRQMRCGNCPESWR